MSEQLRTCINCKQSGGTLRRAALAERAYVHEDCKRAAEITTRQAEKMKEREQMAKLNPALLRMRPTRARRIFRRLVLALERLKGKP